MMLQFAFQTSLLQWLEVIEGRMLLRIVKAKD